MDFSDIEVVLLVLLILSVGLVFSHNAEKRHWNNGICKDNGKPWVLFAQCLHRYCYIYVRLLLKFCFWL